MRSSNLQNTYPTFSSPGLPSIPNTSWELKTFRNLLRPANTGRASNFALFLVIATIAVFPSPEVSAQTSVQMRLTDQTIGHREIKTKPRPNPRRVVLASNTTQESDFAPKQSQGSDSEKKAESTNQLELDGPTSSQLESQDTEEPPMPIDQLDSDKPVDAPEFNLTDDESEDTPSVNKDTDNSASSQAAGEQVVDDSYRLPTVADVRAPILATPLASVFQQDPSGLLSNDQNVNVNQRYADGNTRYTSLSGTAATAKYKTWQAHNFYHRPLYFEDHNLERSGNRRAFQNVASAAQFFATVPTLPYQMGELHPRARVYTFGNARPGDLTDYRINQFSRNQNGTALQTLVTLGIILP